jgi:hypothetical protein
MTAFVTLNEVKSLNLKLLCLKNFGLPKMVIIVRLLQKSEKGHLCHSELVEELRQIKQLEHPSTSSG